METFYNPSVRNIINTGNEVNSNTGDFVRVGFLKTQKNFEELCDKLDVLNVDCLNDFVVTPCPDGVGNVTQRTYSITPNVTLVDLDDLDSSRTVRYSIETTNVSNETILYWNNIGTTDQNNFTDNIDESVVEINFNQGYVDRTIEENTITEQKNIILQLRKASYFSPLVALANTVTILPKTLIMCFDRTGISGNVWYNACGGGGGGGGGIGDGSIGGYLLQGEGYVACGYNYQGQTGWGGYYSGDNIIETIGSWTRSDTYLGSQNDNKLVSDVLIQDVPDDPGIRWKQISSKYARTCGLRTNGKIWQWGNDFPGPGFGSGSGVYPYIQFPEISWDSISLGALHISAIKTNGSLWSWGRNQEGQLGDGTTTFNTSPVQVSIGGTDWKQVSCGEHQTMAIKQDGTLWSWGQGYHGTGFGGGAIYYNPIFVGLGWKYVSCGINHCAAISNSGTLWLWGNNTFGQLGDNTTTERLVPVQVYGGGTDWKQVSCGRFHTAAIKEDGTLWVWGYNNLGQLGDNTRTNRSQPVQTAAGGNNWKKVSCGTGTSSHTAAIKNDGTLWLWGSNGYGQLARGDSYYTESGGLGTGPEYVLIPSREYMNNYSNSFIPTTANNWYDIECGTDNTHGVRWSEGFRVQIFYPYINL